MVFKAIFGNTSNEFVGGIPGLCGVENGKEKILTYFGNGDVLNFHATKAWEKGGSKNLFYYEVRVLSPGMKGTIGIGLTELEKCPGNQQPGWGKGSFGYHADDGGGFENGNVIPNFGPSWATEDAVVGCGIDFANKNIFFVLPNGKKLVLPITSKFPKKVYPLVGMHSLNEKVAVNLGEMPFVHDIEPRPYRYPSAFHLDHAVCTQHDGVLTLTNPLAVSLQANAAFPRLVNVQPYFELRILALKTFEQLAIGFSDQRFRAEQCLGQMQNSFAWHSTGNLAANFGSIGSTSPFKQGDVIGCGVAFDTFNIRRIFVTLNGQFLQFLEAKVSPAMDCFPTISFAGKDIKLSYNFGTAPFVWDFLSAWPKSERQNFISTLPKETLAHIISYAAHSIPFATLCLARVNKQFNTLSADNTIWRRLSLKEFPNQNPEVKIRDWHKYCKKRMQAMVKSSDPNPIENCSFGYECPLLLENLEVSQLSDEVRSCKKCNKDVYIVNSVDQIKFQISLGRCVAFRAVQLRHMVLMGDVAPMNG